MHYGRIRKGFELIVLCCLLARAYKSGTRKKSGICSQLLQFRFLRGIPCGTILKELIQSNTSSPPIINWEVLPRAGCTLVRIKRFFSWLSLRPTCALRPRVGRKYRGNLNFCALLAPLVFHVGIGIFHFRRAFSYCTFDFNWLPPKWRQIHRDYWWANQLILWLQGLVQWLN